MEFGKTCFKNVYYVGTDIHIKHMHISTKSKLLTVVTSAEQEAIERKQVGKGKDTKCGRQKESTCFSPYIQFFFLASDFIDDFPILF